ncbi:MAG: hypothetical protein CML02_16020 [Pseudooceanicola sp.]|jgi:TRAP-type C4-dicarboxylate transport system permease small subunit|nr:hypothetical protein [Pseudooceanicola sp.]
MQPGVSDRFARASFNLGVAAVTAIILFSMLDLISRTLGKPVSWVPEVSVYFFCFAICSSMPHVTRQGSQIAVSLLLEALSPEARRRYVPFVEGLSFLVCMVIAYLCAEICWKQFKAGTITVADLSIPKWVLSAMLTYAFLMSGVMHFVNALSLRKHSTMFGKDFT